MDLLESIKATLHKSHGFTPEKLHIRRVGGGDINQAFLAKYLDQQVFIKANDAVQFPQMFEQEAHGLSLLATTNAFNIPKVLGQITEGKWSFLILEHIEEGARAHDFAERFARGLYQLHATTQPMFGLDHDNYIGSLHQSNTYHEQWSEFFSDERILPQLKLARDGNLLSDSTLRAAERLLHRVDAFFPTHDPALLHGDLWSGNYLVGQAGVPVLIDPAVYFGHPYMDLGMMKLFGGFNSGIYDHYAALASLENDWSTGAEVAQLYPLLVHVNLFGQGYVHQVEQIIRRFA